MNDKFGKDLTQGSIPGNLIRFALPILIGNLLTTGYSIVNALWVGNLLGGNAVGAVAVCFPIMLTMIALASGATMATSILVSQRFGAKDYNSIQKFVNVSWSVALLLIILITVAGLFTSDILLVMLGTPEEIINLASAYLKISISGFIFMYLPYLIMSVLRGIGDTVTPMIFIIMSTIINAVLDPILIIGIGPFPRMGLNGAAVASLLASAFATIAGIVYIRRKYKGLPINLTKLSFDKGFILSIFKIGLPSFFQQMVLSMSYAFVTVFVNMFGAGAIAAFGITSRLDSLVAMPAIAVMMAASTLTAQTLGAGMPGKIRDIFKWGIIINIPVILLISAVCILFPGVVMHLFVKDEGVVKIGVDYFRIVGIGYLFFIVSYVSNGIINGSGKTIATMVISFISLCVVRIPIAALLVRSGSGLRGIWFAILVSIAVTLMNSLLYYYFGKWNRQPIDKVSEVQG